MATPTQDRMAGWSIEKDAWNAFVARMETSKRSMTVASASALTIALFGCVGLPITLILLLPLPLWLDLLLAGVLGALGLAFAVFIIKNYRAAARWRDRLPAIWDEKGCVCPVCLAPLARHADDRDSCGHGYILEDQPFVVRYLEATATANPTQATHSSRWSELGVLRQRVRARGTATADAEDLVLAARRLWNHWFGFDQPLWRRIVAPIAIIGALAAAVYPIAGIYTVAFVWVFAFALPGSRAFAKARYLLDHGKSGSTRYNAIGACCMFMASVFPTTLAPLIGRNLPTETLFAIGERIPQATEDTFDVLASRPLSPQDQQRLADQMLPFIAEWTRGGGTIDRTRHLRHVRHLASCVANGTLPNEYRQKLVDALLLIDIKVDGRGIDPNASAVAITAGTTPTIALAFGGQAKTADWRGRDHAMFSKVELNGEVVWSGTEGAPVTTGSFPVADTSVAGDRTLVVRGWFALTRIWGNATGGSIKRFDHTDRPVLPDDSYGAWPIERKITLRIQ